MVAFSFKNVKPFPNIAGEAFETKILKFLSGGMGYPPGTKPEACRACKGSGMVGSGTLPLYELGYSLF